MTKRVVDTRSAAAMFTAAKALNDKRDLTLYFDPINTCYRLTYKSKDQMSAAGYGVITVVRGTGTPAPDSNGDGELVEQMESSP